MAKRSSLFRNRRIETIHTGVNTEHFRPLPKPYAAEYHEFLPQRTKIEFCATHLLTNRRKGFDTAQRVCETLTGKGFDVTLYVGGASFGPEGSGYQIDYLGILTTPEQLCRLHNSGDIMIAPYRQDNLPNVVLEALSYGACIVASIAGGIPELIENGVSGFLVDPEDIAAFSEIIEKLITSPELCHQIGSNARNHCLRNFETNSQTTKYVSLIKEMAHTAWE